MKTLEQKKVNLYEDTEGLNIYLTKNETAIIIDRISFINDFLKNNNWLDLCCGKGINSLLLKIKENSKYTGIDFIEENCHSTRKLSKSKVICADAHELPFKENLFDTVTLSAAIYYLDRDKLLPEIYRVLKKDGLFIFDTSNCELPGFIYARESNNYFSAKNWLTFIKKKGFEVECYGSSQKFEKSSIDTCIKYFKGIIKSFLFQFPVFKNRLRNISLKFKTKIYFDKTYVYKNINSKKNWSKINQKQIPKSVVLYFVCKKA